MLSPSVVCGLTRPIIRSAAIILCLPFTLQAQFTPIALTPESFNHDLVVERTAPPPLIPVTTASVETGITNTGFSWFEKGYNADWPQTGLPMAGSVIQSEFRMDHEYQFAPDYRANNGVLIDSMFTHAELVLLTPSSFAALSFFLSGAHDRAWAPVAYAAHHADGSVETNTIRCKDWFDSTLDYAFTPHGRVNVGNFTFADINANLPKIFAVDVTLTNRSSAITSVELSYVSGPGHSVLMALSGATDPAGPFAPVAFTGYNADVVVEATAARPQLLLSVTTATMTLGSANRSWTWYERGYVPCAPASGLPPAGSLVTNAASPNQIYLLAPSYTANNAALLESESPAVNLTPATPVACGSLSFLTASAGGPATNQCLVQHADGSAQTNSLVSPDWMDETVAPALSAAGRVSISNRLLEHVNGLSPNLFAVELTLSNTTSTVTNILLQCEGTATAHTVFLGVSAKSGGIQPAPPSLSIRVGTGGAIIIESSAPGRLEYTTALQGQNTVWQSAGTITASVPLTLPEHAGEARFYRVVAP